MNEDDLSQYSSLMTAGGATQGTSNFENSPSYNLLFGSGAAQSYAANPVSTLAAPTTLSFNDFANTGLYQTAYGSDNAADPSTRFQQDPGVQLALQEGERQLSNNYAAKGLGASGASAAGLMQNLYSNYNTYTNQQANMYQQAFQNQQTGQQNQLAAYTGQQNLMNSSFSNYQNQLAGVANTGIGLSSALGTTENSTAQSLSSLLSGNIMNTGALTGSANLSTSSDIASLLANLGVYNSNAILNTGAAQSNNLMQGSQLGAQLANQQNSQNAGANATAAAGGLGRFF